MSGLNKAWNGASPQFLQSANRAQTTAQKLVGYGLSYLAAAAGTAWLSSLSHRWLPGFLEVYYAPPVLRAVAYTFAAYLGALGVGSFLELPGLYKAPKWEKELNDSQRQLLGLSKSPSPAPPAGPSATGSTAKRTQQQPPLSPLTPVHYQRSTVPSPGGITPVPLESAGQLPSETRSASPGLAAWRNGGRRRSPYGDAAVTTPEGLQRYLNAFEETTASSKPQELGYGSYDASPGGSHTYQGGQGRYGASPSLRVPPPVYRPSRPPPRGKAGSPHRPDGRLQPSLPDAVAEALTALQADGRTLEVWTERFREWLASQALKPLVRQLDGAHGDVMSAAAQLGWAGVRLPPLGLASTGATAAAAGAVGAGAEADDEVMIGQLREQLVAGLRGAQQGQPQTAMAWTCLEAVQRYQRLAAVLRGEGPRGLLPPAPRGYLAHRLRQLAGGSCMKAFTWDAGGAWQGKPWTADLPTDSAVVLYLFAAFLEAPRWQFPVAEPAVQLSTGGPLYLGTLPTRPPEFYYAILPLRPTGLSKGCVAVLGLGLGTLQPHFTFVMDGEAQVTLCHHTAVLQALLLLARAAQLRGGAALGGRSLEYLKLAAVLRPAEPTYNLFRGKWFGIW